jgi:glucosamine--fructose-6-phosphate aminotransferase (isomerizing)
MLKEIMEQPASILRAMNNGGRILNGECVKLGGLDSCLPELLTVNHLILLGCGTSFHAGLWALNLFKSLHLMATIYDGAEFNCDDIPTGGRTALILLSQSGETKDLHRCIKIAKEMSVLTIGIVNVTDSLIARETDCGIYLNAGRECAVASTKSFTNQCIVLAMVAVWFSQIRNTAIEKRRQIIADLRQVSGTMQTFLDNSLGVDEKLKSVVDRIAGQHSLFILGKGRTEAIAKEGALKIKEVAYIHAEGYSSSALKHGPFALIVPHLPIIILDIHPEHRDKNNNVYYETTARGADVIIISTQEAYGEAGADVFHIPYNGTFSDLLANVYLQLISYYLGLKHGDPDYPRNLAKVVTVE